jgi:hypothetical protein
LILMSIFYILRFCLRALKPLKTLLGNKSFYLLTNKRIYTTRTSVFKGFKAKTEVLALKP